MLWVLESSHWHCQYYSSRMLLYSFQLVHNTTSSCFQRSPKETVLANKWGGKRAPHQCNSLFAAEWKRSVLRVKHTFLACLSFPGYLKTYLNSSKSVLYKQISKFPPNQSAFSCVGLCTAILPSCTSHPCATQNRYMHLPHKHTQASHLHYHPCPTRDHSTHTPPSLLPPGNTAPAPCRTERPPQPCSEQRGCPKTRGHPWSALDASPWSVPSSWCGARDAHGRYPGDRCPAKDAHGPTTGRWCP